MGLDPVISPSRPPPQGFAPALDAAGRVALRPSTPRDAAQAEGLARSPRTWLDASEAPLVYATVDLTAPPTLSSALAQAGLVALGTLIHLRRPATQTGPRDWPAGVEVVPASSAPPLELVQAIDASMEGSLDWPELQGRIPTEQTLRGLHGEGGAAQRWLVRALGGRPAGAIFVDTSEQGSSNLSYVGLAPALRRSRLAHPLVVAALARLVGSHEVLTAIDARNSPALRLAAAVGFQPVRHQHLWILPFDRPLPSS